jgi:Antitoxin VbhA
MSAAQVIPLFQSSGHPRRHHGQCQRCDRVDYLPWATEHGVRYCGHCHEADALSYVALRDAGAREEAVKNAVAITQQEGGEPSAYCSAQLALFVAGEITVREMADRVVAYASRKPDTEIAHS